MTARLTGSSAVLLVADIKPSAAYYRDRLGFSCDLYGHPPHAWGIADTLSRLRQLGLRPSS